MRIVGFEDRFIHDLCREIENYAQTEKLEIKQISAYADSSEKFSQKAIVVFEEKGE